MSSRSRIITIIIISALTIYAGIHLYSYWRQHDEILESITEARRETEELQQKIADLRYMLDHIDDPDVMRRIAEDILGYVSPDELIITDGSGVR